MSSFEQLLRKIEMEGLKQYQDKVFDVDSVADFLLQKLGEKINENDQNADHGENIDDDDFVLCYCDDVQEDDFIEPVPDSGIF